MDRDKSRCTAVAVAVGPNNLCAARARLNRSTATRRSSDAQSQGMRRHSFRPHETVYVFVSLFIQHDFVDYYETNYLLL